MQIFNVERGICVYAMVPDEMMKLPVTCVRFYPLPVDGDHTEPSHIVAASCKHIATLRTMTMTYFISFFIGCWHDTVVCPSVCLSVTLHILALKVGLRGSKLHRCVPRIALPIHLFKFIHFCCRMCRLSIKRGHCIKS